MTRMTRRTWKKITQVFPNERTRRLVADIVEQALEEGDMDVKETLEELIETVKARTQILNDTIKDLTLEIRQERQERRR